MSDATDIGTYGIALELNDDVIGQKLDALGARGEQAAGRIRGAFTKTQQELIGSATQTAQQFSSRLEQQFAADRARIKEGIARGFLTPQEARKAGQDAAREFNSGVLSQLDQLGGTGLSAGNSKVYRELADSIKGIDLATGRAAPGLSSLRSAVTSTLASVTSAIPGVTQFSSALGAMALGTTSTIAILGGIAAIAYAYDKLTESTRKAKEEQDRLNKVGQDFLNRQGRPAGDIGTLATQTSQNASQLLTDRNRLQTEYNDLIARQQKGEEGLGLAIGTKYEALRKANGVYVQAAAQARVYREESDRLTAASKQSVTSAQLEIEHQERLNETYRYGATAVAVVNAEYTKLASLQQARAQASGAERQNLIDAATALEQVTVKSIAARAAIDLYTNAQKQLIDTTHTLNAAASGVLSRTNAASDPAAQWKATKEQVAATNAALEQTKREIAAIAQGSNDLKQEFSEIAKRIREAQRYSDDMRQIWRDGIGRIVTDGTKSFQDFFEDVYRLFGSLLKRMEEAGKGDTIGAKLLGYGAAAVGGFSSGYASGNAGVGVLSGVVAGSAYGPFGAIIGGLSGLTGGLLGGAKAARERREAEEQLRRAYTLSIAQIKNQVGDLSDLEYAKLQSQAQFDQLRKNAIDLYGNDAKYAQWFDSSWKDRLPDALNEINALQQKYTQQLEQQAEATAKAAQAEKDLANQRSQQNSTLRYLNATGQSDAAYELQQQIELNEAVADGLDGVSLNLLIQAQWAEKAQREREKQTTLLQDQLSTAQQSFDAFKGIYDSLSSFAAALKLSQYSPLSPRQQLDTARGQLDSLYQAALGGDQAAANQFSGVAQSFLDASRRYNASGAGYVMDYNSVSVMTDALKNYYGAQMTDARRQVDLLQQQLETLNAIATNTAPTTDRPGFTPRDRPGTSPVGPSAPGGGTISANAIGVTQAGFTALIEEVQALRAAVEKGATDTRRGLDAVAQKVA